MMEKKIAIIDYQMGNIGSISNMLKKIGYQSIVSSDKTELRKYRNLILPGVGSFEKGVTRLKDLDLYDFLSNTFLGREKNLLGICLGMQLLFDSSEEGPGLGLGLIKGKVKKFKELDSKFKIPHMGWNFIKKTKEDSFMKYVEEESRYYFVHSFYAKPLHDKDILAYTNYGNKKFASIVSKENIFGTQFHPEKSHKFGFKILKGFCEL